MKKTNKSNINKNDLNTSTPKKKGRPRKNSTSDNTTICEVKPKRKYVRKQMAKKVINHKRNKIEKNLKNNRKDLKNNKKDFFKKAKKIYQEAHKNVSLLKKTTKAYSKLITESFKTGDEKIIKRIQKLFGYAGYITNEDNTLIQNVITTKLRIPKSYKKTSVATEQPKQTLVTKISKTNDQPKPKRKYVRKVKAQVEDTQTEEVAKEQLVAPVENLPSSESNNDITQTINNNEQMSQVPGESFDEPTDEELDEIENEFSEENEDGDFGSEDDESEDNNENEFEDDIFKEVSLRDRSESDDEIYTAMKENGDIDY